jgi:hypothetical protein
MKLSEIAETINNRAADYRMGRFQHLRKELKGKSRLPSRKIFSPITTKEKWAFHWGGRTEIQFNIGFEPRGKDQVFRYGVAFSLETSQSLPDIEVLFPKIKRFNQYVREAASELSDMQMWHWYNDERSGNDTIREIPDEFLKPGYFIFLGKLTNLADVNPDDILKDFDRLLNLYEYVEK